jgi:hypothetical protein
VLEASLTREEQHMKRSGVVHLAGALIATFYLLASSPVAAQARFVPLSDKGGVYPYQQAVSKTVPVTDPVNWLYCIDSVQGFAIFTPSPTSQTEIFAVTQTDPSILGFSNSPSGPFSPTINVTINAGASQSAPFYALGANLGKSVFSGCSPDRCLINNISILVYAVEKVELKAADSPFDNNPNTGGGLRIFSDKKSGDDLTDMRKVKVTANLSIGYPFAQIPVFFKAFDVDDPSSDDAPVDPNGSAGDDNRGIPKPGQLSATQAFADANGVAQVDFAVTMQPGDNFRVAASCYSGYLDQVVVSGINLADGVQTLPSKHVQGTDMLTVWRRLHIEVDSMGPVKANLAEGNVLKARPSDRKGRTVLTLSALDDYRRFETGRISIDGGVGSFPVVDSGSSTVTVEGVVADSDATGKHFTIVDDDDFNDDDGSQLDGDIDEDVPAPHLDLVLESDKSTENVFAPAYVRPTYDLSNDTPEVPFVLNFEGDAKNPTDTAHYKFDNQKTEKDPAFWTVYLLGAYQYTTDEDGDGDRITTWGSSDGSLLGASVFLEVGRPLETLRYKDNPSVNPAATTAHELGHSFQRDHSTDGSLMCSPRYRKNTSFSDETLNNIRNAMYP